MPRTGMYVLQGVEPAAIAAAPFDVKVIDIYDNNGRLFTPTQVAQMGGGPGSALLLGYFSIGEAETYRDYFKTIPKAALGPENPQWDGNYEVAYWTPEWRKVATTYIDKMIAAGYDGVYFDVVDEFQTAWARSHAPGGAGGALQEMIDLIKYLHDYANAKRPGFKVWVNNAEELLTHQDYLATIDGMFKENLFYSDSGQKQPASETRDSLEYLNKAIAAGKDVVAIEYVSGQTKVDDVHAKADAAGIGSYVAHLDLDGVDMDGVLPGQVIHPDNLPPDTPPPVTPPATDPPPTGGNPDTPTTPPTAQKPLIGDDGDNRLKGTSADELLKGGAGHDRLTGRDGADTFAFSEYGRKDWDTITDFKHGQDKIGLDHSVFHVGGAGALSSDVFFVGTRAHDESDRIIYNQSKGELLYDLDGTGSASAKLIAKLDDRPTLDVHDFLSF